MNSPNYFSKIINFADSIEYLDGANILAFLESLNYIDWKEFLFDLCNESNKLAIIFAPKTTDSIFIAACSHLDKLGMPSRRLLVKALENKIENFCFDTKEIDESIILNYFFLVKKMGQGASVEVLDKFVQNENLSLRVRQEAGFVMVNLFEPPLESYWEQIDFEKYTFLLPAIISQKSRKNPLEMFKFLESLGKEKLKANLPTFEYSIKKAMVSLFIYDKSINLINQVLRIINRLPQDIQKKIKFYKEYKEIYHYWEKTELTEVRIEPDYSTASLIIGELVIKDTFFPKIEDNLKSLKMSKENNLEMLPAIFDRMAQVEAATLEERKSDQEIVQRILSTCLKKGTNYISVFRTILERSSLNWSQDDTRDLVIWLSSSGKKICGLQVTDNFFISQPNLGKLEFIELSKQIEELYSIG